MSRRISVAIFPICLLLLLPVVAAASSDGETFPASRTWQVRFDHPNTKSVPLKIEIPAVTQDAQARPQAVEHGGFHDARRKIHVIASYATIPLFVGEYLAGDKLYDGNGSSTAKSAHGAFTAGLAALFGVNTVTGVWNLVDERKEPGHTRRLVHGLLMLAADAGFIATASLAPDDDDRGFSSDRSAHRNMAITSMGLAAASYIYMLVTR